METKTKKCKRINYNPWTWEIPFQTLCRTTSLLVPIRCRGNECGDGDGPPERAWHTWARRCHREASLSGPLSDDTRARARSRDSVAKAPRGRDLRAFDGSLFIRRSNSSFSPIAKRTETNSDMTLLSNLDAVQVVTVAVFFNLHTV